MFMSFVMLVLVVRMFRAVVFMVLVAPMLVMVMSMGMSVHRAIGLSVSVAVFVCVLVFMLMLVCMPAHYCVTSIDPVLLSAFVVANVGVAHRRQFTGGMF